VHLPFTRGSDSGQAPSLPWRMLDPETRRQDRMHLRSMAALAALSLLLAACRVPAAPTTTTMGQADDTAADTVASTSTEPADEPTDSAETSQWGLPLIDPIDVDPSVDVSIAGSSTVFPLSTAILTR